MAAAFLTACSGTQVKNNNAASIDAQHKVLAAMGQSLIRQAPGLSQQQRKLNADQAAKMEAYRGLAALLYRERLAGGGTIAERVMQDEGYRIYLDLFLREAKVDETQALGNVLRVNLALSLNDRFYQCMGGDATVVRQCLLQDNKLLFTRLGYNMAELKTVNLGCGVSDCSDLFHVGGFNRHKNGFDRALLSAGLYDSEWIGNTSARLLVNFFLLHGFAH